MTVDGETSRCSFNNSELYIDIHMYFCCSENEYVTTERDNLHKHPVKIYEASGVLFTCYNRVFLCTNVLAY